MSEHEMMITDHEHSQHQTPLQWNQPKKSPSPSVGVRAAGWMWGGPLWSPVGGAPRWFIDKPSSPANHRVTIKALPSQPNRSHPYKMRIGHPQENAPTIRQHSVSHYVYSRGGACPRPETCSRLGARVLTLGARALTLALALLFTLSLFLFPLLTSAHAISNTDAGRIYGQLQDGTKRNAPVAGQSVTLQMEQGNNARDLTSVTTDAHGMFSFRNLKTDKTINYALYTLYQGAQYYTDLIDLSTMPVKQNNLTIYEATSSTSTIAVVQANILIDKIATQNSFVTVSENFFFENLGRTTYVGSLHKNGNKPNALRFSLPKNARNLSLSSDFNGYQVIQVDPGFATDAAVPPGTSQFAFSFQVPYTTSSYDFSQTIVYPTVNLTLLVPLNIHASSAALVSQGPVNANQRTFQQFNAKKLLAGSQIHVQLDGLPLSQPATNPRPLNQNTLWVILVLLLMLAIVSVTWFIYRFSRRKVPILQKQTSGKGGSNVVVGRKPLDHLDSSRTISTSNDAHPSQEDQQKALLLELLNLDKAYEAGTLKKVEYEERRNRTKAQLRSLMHKDAVEQPATAKKTTRSSGKGVS